jgi:hypothetical protein
MFMGPSMLLPLLSLSTTIITTTHAFYIPIVAGIDSDNPTASGYRLYLWDGRPVRWDTGEVAALLETSSAVRISHRGIHFYDHDVFPLSTGYACPRADHSLCVLAHDGNRLFPMRSPPTYNPSPAADIQPPMRHASAIGCDSSGEEGRWDPDGGRVVVSSPATAYDISLCDLDNVDVIWTRGIVHVDPDVRLPLWAYVASALCVLFLVVSLGQNIGRVLGDPSATTHPWFTELLCLGQCALLLALTPPYRVWVAEHDRAMLWATAIYIALYLARHAFSLAMHHHVHTLNVVTATLVLVTARLYCSFETPYATIFLLLLLTRLAHKLCVALDHQDRHRYPRGLSAIEHLTISIDGLYTAMHARLAYHPSFFDPQVSGPYLVALCVACLAAGGLTRAVEKRAEPVPKPQGVRACAGVGAVDHNRDAVAFRAYGGDSRPNLRLQFRQC